MNVFFDICVLASAAAKQSVSHERSFSVLKRVQNHQAEGVIAAHSLAEIYAVLTKLPPPCCHTPELAFLGIEENVLKYFKTVNLAGTGGKARLIGFPLGGTIREE